jgi:Purple acid Phosphatase, N-terminal domain/Calcineurin-like phosphoesterase
MAALRPQSVYLPFLAFPAMSESGTSEPGMSESDRLAASGSSWLSRRKFLTGVVGFGAFVGLAGTSEGPLWHQDAFAATAPPGPSTTTLPLPTATRPEQLLLTWGADPATSVTVSWSAPGTVAQPMPKLAYSTSPITASNPGRVVALPPAAPLDVTRRYGPASSVSFTDGLNAQTTYHYHAQLTGLRPGTRYYYQVSDGAATPSLAGSSFRTAPSGRAKFRFSSYGDLSTPSWDLNASGNIWHESCDNAYYAVSAIESPGDGGDAPLFHLLNGDLCYANLDILNAPAVWRDFGVNIARSAANRPWMPALGNHETEFGVCDHAGRPGTAPGGIAAQGAASHYWNGPYGYGHYLSRFLLPDNGLTNWDGNRLHGNFYRFQVGTVLFISLDADDVIYQDGGSAYLSAAPNAAPETTTSGAQIPNGTVTYNHGYTGDLKIVAADNSAVPDRSNGRPNLQTLWLGRTLAQASRDPSVDMIVVFMHQCAMSTSVPGNGSDLGIRRAWLPLFDRYQVDLVLSGHEHDYERSYPVRGYDRGAHGKVVSPNPGSQATGFTRNAADSIEDAPWSAATNAGDAYGYAIFDVDPGDRPGDTTITMKYFAIPAVSNEAGTAHDGTTTLPTTPFETFVFGRRVHSGQHGSGPHQGRALAGSRAG